MNTLYLVQTETQLNAYRELFQPMQARLLPYLEHLRTAYAAQDFPRSLILTDVHTATHGISSIPVPAYTNDHRIVFTPELSAWQSIYLRQMDSYPSQDTRVLRLHYAERLTENHLLQILGHELAHHSELFLTDEDYESGVWFEEGMAEYVSRKWFLTPEEFEEERHVNRALVSLFQQAHGWHSLEDFGQKTYEGDYASIFYEYWRSFLAIDELVERYGSIRAVFDDYKKWHDSPVALPLTEWFRINI